MSILTWTTGGFEASPASAHSRGIFGRVLDGIVASRTAKVMPIVTAALQRLSDQELSDLGHSQADIARLRKLPQVYPDFIV